MQNKLTLRIDEKLIAKAKAFAKSNGKSVSQIVADYFNLLDKKNKPERTKTTPIVNSLKGSLRGSNIDEKDYHKYLEDKYL